MPHIYITQSEAYILSFFDNNIFEAEHRQLHHDYTRPKVVRAIRDQYGYSHGIDLLDYVIHRVDIRYQHAKDRRNKAELDAYRCFLMKCKSTLEQVQAAARPPQGLWETVIDFYRGNRAKADQGALRP